jgi:hypothetical protein
MAIVSPATRTTAHATCPATGNPSPKAKSALPDEREDTVSPIKSIWGNTDKDYPGLKNGRKWCRRDSNALTHW